MKQVNQTQKKNTLNIQKFFFSLSVGLFAIPFLTEWRVAHAAPAKLDLTLSEHSTAKIKKMLNDPKTWKQIPQKVLLCVYSPNGANGEAFEQATSYISELPRIAQVAKGFGVNMHITRPSKLQMQIEVDYPKLKQKTSTTVNLKVYTDERVLTEDFRSKKCDGAGISNLRARQFNPFVGSIDAIGAVQSYKQLTQVIQLLARPEFDSKMINKDYEVVGVVPLGAAYIMVNDRRIDTLPKAAGKKVAVMNFDATQKKLVQNVGAQPVTVDLTSVGGKFNNKEVDIMAAPAILFDPLELHKGLEDKSGKVVGAIIKFPLIQVTGTLIMHRNKFPDGMGAIAREIIAKQLDPAFEFVDKTERAIPAKYWMDIRDAERAGYLKIMREARIQMTKEGYYDKDMMRILKKVRCSQDPKNFECSLNDE
ncbi:putative solute-binding protein [Acinetobacter shaoyimingii]|uniref:RND transporter n=1 Tax=Acinetobacter shaoyimingii TaxID=2715164 RepID=A0A6G8RU36_9GAMM|nr:putative solute-binding protein [Acinetobacter shaoyimingii]QIO05387.1 RND transporter [Acinetobacter shaoyimingii]